MRQVHHNQDGPRPLQRADDPAYAMLLDGIAHRRLDGVALLWLSGHRPLAFIAGQLCWLVAPLALLCGWPQVETWAAALSTPQGGERLMSDLRLHTQQPSANRPQTKD